MKKLTILTILLSFSLFSWKNPQSISKKLKKILGNNWAYIPSGNAKSGEIMQNVNDFYIFKTEVSNLDYRTFLESIKEKNPAQYKSALPDTTVWKSDIIAFNDSYMTQYFRYPGFSQYPVVGISHANALIYCKWLEESINSQLNETTKVVVKLPTELEWIRAARGDNYQQLYAWEGSEVVNKKGWNLANYKKEKQNNSAGMIITAGTKSYRPNEFGIYNMSGNLAEMLDEPKKVKGGSWNMPANALKIDEIETVGYPSNNVGFRPVLMLVSK
ncbi:MAG: SUMF1/EgtB/PvdO family nonheme iron enzyme [Arcicella sp.]|nr:SUMF1/EgtB/PvdO family nonheme iron enzyme [Arcicella sp.]